MDKKQVEYARHDPALALVSLFRPLYDTKDRPGGLTVETHHDGLHLKFAIWQALDARDQLVLLTAIGFAGISGQELYADTQNGKGQQLWQNLEPANQAEADKAIVITTTRYRMLKAIGEGKGGKNYDSLEDCLERLSNVGCRARKEGYDWSMRLLSYSLSPDETLHIALNSRFAAALTGQYVHVSLHERQNLTKDPAKLAHAWLSAWLRPGRTRGISLDKLSEKVWGESSESSDAAIRKRRQRIKEAIDEINSLNGWRIEIDGKGKRSIAQVSRPNIIEQRKT
jgi:hypothetical protein